MTRAVVASSAVITLLAVAALVFLWPSAGPHRRPSKKKAPSPAADIRVEVEEETGFDWDDGSETEGAPAAAEPALAGDAPAPLEPTEEEEVLPPLRPVPGPDVAPGFEIMDQGDLESAEDYFVEHTRLYPLDPEGHYGLGIVYRTGEFFDLSVEEFAKTLLLNPEHLQSKLQVAEMFTFQTKDDYETAERFYEEILGQVPEEKSALNGLGAVYLQTGRVEAAIQVWEGLKREMPDSEALDRNLEEAYRIRDGANGEEQPQEDQPEDESQ